MARDTGKHSPPSPEALFSATQAPVPSSPRFWVRLLASRPLTVLGSLWLVIICVGAVAIQRLVFNTPDQSTAEAPSQVQAARLATGTPPEDIPLGEAEPDRTTAHPRQKANMILWGFSGLALCALGSWAITLQTKATGRRRPKRRVRRRVPSKAKAPSGPRRLQPYSPERDAVIVQGARAVVDTLPLTLTETDARDALDDIDALALNLFDDDPLPTGQTRAPRPSVPRPQTAPQPPAQGTQVAETAPHQPEVLADGETHPLDWEEDSLAHTLDLRQRRSLSSLM
ncbi:MAG: hypothetical protein VKI82_00450 [Leptolyngbya sp.]|nr:hypothetical protein [Leptolyngbya sp.]